MFLFEQILCYACFGPVSANHNTRNCKNVRKGKNVKFEKKKRHTNSLHDYTTKKPKEKLEEGCEEKENEQRDFH